jgi:hypothetical protein
MVAQIYERIHEIEFELTDAEYEIMQRAFAVVRLQVREDLTDDECLVIALTRAAGLT